MNRRTFHAVIVVALILAAAAYAITLQATGQTEQAEHFVEWAGGGIGTIVLLLVFFG